MTDLIAYKKPIIGIVGGIGAGKSFVASLFGELGAAVIRSDDLVHQVYQRPDVRQTLRDWWGDEVFKPDGSLDRRAVARKVFSDERERLRLEGYVHPLVNQEREQIMLVAEGDPEVRAFVWDTPLLIETGLHTLCDTVVFVDAPPDVRAARVSKRGWDPDELCRRENLQLPLDNKREIAEYVIRNAADSDAARNQVRHVFSSILEKRVGRG